MTVDDAARADVPAAVACLVDAFDAQWAAFGASVPGLVERFDAYERIAAKRKPAAAHHYLGVIGIAPRLQGQGAGRLLLDAFCARAEADPRSAGVYLETASRASLAFYLRNGFHCLGDAELDAATPLWCLFRAVRRV